MHSDHKPVEIPLGKLRISVGSYHANLGNDLNRHCVCQHIVIRMMMQGKYEHMRISGELTNTADNDQDFLGKILTGDKT